MKTYEVLEKALALIEDEKDWTTGVRGWIGPAAGGYCAEGALCRVVAQDGISGWRDSAAYEAVCPEGEHLWTFNDSHTHAEVVALFQEAIRNEKAKEGIPLDVPAEEPQEVLA